MAAPQWRRAVAATAAAAGLLLLLTAETDLTYYDRVGVLEDAELSTIKKAYRAKAMQLHPDRNLERSWLQQWWAGDSTHQFSRLVEAHDCLVDETCRAKYDEEIRGIAREKQMHWADRWALRRRAKEAQWQQAWASVGSPRELTLLALYSLQDAVISVPEWLPGLLTPRGLIRGTFFLLIFLLSVEIVLKPALSLLWLPARALRWLLLEVTGQRRRNEAAREARKAEVRERQQAQALAGPEPEPEPEPEPWEEYSARVEQDPLTGAQKLAIAQGVGKFAGGNDGSSVKTGCELLIKILDAILQQPDEQKYRKIRTANKSFAKLLALSGARDLIFRVGFEPTSDYLHLVLPPRKMLAAAHAKKALLVAYDTTQGKLG